MNNTREEYNKYYRDWHMNHREEHNAYLLKRWHERKNRWDYWATEIFKCIRQRCVNTGYSPNAHNLNYFKKGIELRMTKDRWMQFCRMRQGKIESMLKNTDRNNRPSINRIDNNGHYEIGNIEIISMIENQHKRKNNKNK
jgi:hypothetical protein